jgi:hypothetical protein
MALASAAATLMQAPEFLRHGALFQAAQAAGPDLLHDTFNGLLAFIVPGRDPYSLHQGVSTGDPGGVDAGATEALIATATVLGTYLALWLRRETGPLNVTVATGCFLLSLTHRQP